MLSAVVAPEIIRNLTFWRFGRRARTGRGLNPMSKREEYLDNAAQ